MRSRNRIAKRNELLDANAGNDMAVNIKGWVVVDGFASTRRHLRRCLDKDAKKAMNKAIREGVLDIILPAVQREAPVGKGLRPGDTPGRLRKSITVRVSLTKASMNIGNKRVVYAGPVHWGWPKRNIKPNPFVYRGLSETIEPFLEHLVKVFEEYEKECNRQLNRPI